MIEYERIDILEGIDVDKTNKSIECMICHYWYFLNKNLFMDHIFVMVAIIYYKILKIIKILLLLILKKNAYRIYFQHINKHKPKK